VYTFNSILDELSTKRRSKTAWRGQNLPMIVGERPPAQKYSSWFTLSSAPHSNSRTASSRS
jgi:hypothetical protein